MSIALMNVENMSISARAFLLSIQMTILWSIPFRKTVMAFGVYDIAYGKQHIYFSNTKTLRICCILEQQLLKEQKQYFVFQGEQGTNNSRCKETKKYWHA